MSSTEWDFETQFKGHRNAEGIGGFRSLWQFFGENLWRGSERLWEIGVSWYQLFQSLILGLKVGLQPLDTICARCWSIPSLSAPISRRSLDLSFNSIKHISSISHLSNCSVVYFVQNKISKVREGDLASPLGDVLTSLELGGNRLRVSSGSLKALLIGTDSWKAKWRTWVAILLARRWESTALNDGTELISVFFSPILVNRKYWTPPSFGRALARKEQNHKVRGELPNLFTRIPYFKFPQLTFSLLPPEHIHPFISSSSLYSIQQIDHTLGLGIIRIEEPGGTIRQSQWFNKDRRIGRVYEAQDLRHRCEQGGEDRRDLSFEGFGRVLGEYFNCRCVFLASFVRFSLPFWTSFRLDHSFVLQANDNQIPNILDLEPQLGPNQCPKLETVYLEGNPLQKAEGAAYRRKVKLSLPQLVQIDATMVR